MSKVQNQIANVNNGILQANRDLLQLSQNIGALAGLMKQQTEALLELIKIVKEMEKDSHDT